jgi:endonuclease III
VLDIGRCLTKLEGFYGPLPQPPNEPFLYYVWEILGVRSIPRRRDAALAALKRARALTPDSLGRAPQAKLEAAVALAGANAEARLQALRAGADLFRRSPRLPAMIKGSIRGAHRALKAFPQLGGDGVRRMLLFAGGHAVWPRDAHVGRVCRRLEPSAAGGSTVQRAVARALPPGTTALRRAFLYLSHHGVATCTEREPHCGVCPLLEECPAGPHFLRINGAEPRDRKPASMR